MKLMNKKTLLILAIIGSMVLIGDFILYFAMGVISEKAFDITAKLSGVLAIVSAVFFLAPNEKGIDLKNSRQAEGIRLQRTKESTLFEATAALIVIITWLIAIATHNVGLVAPIIFTAIVIAFLVKAYHKRRSTFSIWPSRNIRYNTEQILIFARLDRIMAVVTALFSLVAVCSEVNIKILISVYTLLCLLLEFGGEFFIIKNK